MTRRAAEERIAMIYSIPLTVLPLIVYNAVGYSISGADPWSQVLMGIPMMSGETWTLNYGEILIVFGIVMLFFEVMKAARASSHNIANHVLSTIVLIVYVVEFVVAPVAANSVFLILTAIALFDVVAGFSITIRTATRDVAIGNHHDQSL